MCASSYVNSDFSLLTQQSAIDKGQALILATQEGRAADVKNFLREGVPVDYRDVTDGRDSTSLMWAAWNGHLECVRVLVEGGTV